MRAFFLATGFFVAVNAITAGAFLAMGSMLPNEARHNHWAWLAIGLVALAIGIGSAVGAVRLISRRG